MISEISDNASMAMQAIKLLARYKGGRVTAEAALTTVGDWLEDAACNRNPYVLLVAGLIYASEGNHVEALKACHSGAMLEMWVAAGGWGRARARQRAMRPRSAAEPEREDSHSTHALNPAHASVAPGRAGWRYACKCT